MLVEIEAFLQSPTGIALVSAVLGWLARHYDLVAKIMAYFQGVSPAPLPPPPLAPPTPAPVAISPEIMAKALAEAHMEALKAQPPAP